MTSSRSGEGGSPGSPRRLGWRLASAAVCGLAGFMLATSAAVSRGLELRSDRNTDVADLVRAERQHNKGLTEQVARERARLEELTVAQRPASESQALDAAQEQAGLTAVEGPGVTVVLRDAPSSVQPAGVDPDVLVVHQQDIQAVLNLMWQGGAEAVTLQGQRVISTTGIKCVGNTVVIKGVPYAPPYEIAAIGDPERIEATLARSGFVAAYRKIAAAYQLGWEQRREQSTHAPAYDGVTGLRWAKPRQP